jgi:hypothetical protein
MKKRLIALILGVLSAMLLLTSCGQQKILHCDFCGKEVKVSANSGMTEDWTIWCAECEKELGDVVEAR